MLASSGDIGQYVKETELSVMLEMPRKKKSNERIQMSLAGVIAFDVPKDDYEKMQALLSSDDGKQLLTALEAVKNSTGSNVKKLRELKTILGNQAIAPILREASSVDFSMITIDNEDIAELLQKVLGHLAKNYSNVTGITLGEIGTTLDLSVFEKFKNLRTFACGDICIWHDARVTLPPMPHLETFTCKNIWGNVTLGKMPHLTTFTCGNHCYGDLR